MELEVLLSDYFLEFADKIKSLAAQKKQLQADFKIVYDKFQSDNKAVDQAILAAQKQFEDWKKEVALNSGDG